MLEMSCPAEVNDCFQSDPPLQKAQWRLGTLEHGL